MHWVAKTLLAIVCLLGLLALVGQCIKQSERGWTRVAHLNLASW